MVEREKENINKLIVLVIIIAINSCYKLQVLNNNTHLLSNERMKIN